MPEIDNESRKWLYQTLTSPEYGLNLGTPQEFDSLMTNNEESRKWLWEQANSFGLNVGANYDEFNSLVNPAPQRTDVSDVQQAEQANTPVAEVAAQPQQEAIPTATMEQVDNAGHYQPRSGAELKTPEQLEAEVQNSLPTSTTENEPKHQEVHGENLSGFAYPYNKGLMHEDPNRNDGNFIGNVINNPKKNGKEDVSDVERKDNPYNVPTEFSQDNYDAVAKRVTDLQKRQDELGKLGQAYGQMGFGAPKDILEASAKEAKEINKELDVLMKYQYDFLRSPEGQAYLDRYDEMCDQMDAAIKEAGGDKYSWQGRLGEAFANTSPTDIKALTPEEEQRQKDMADYGNKLIKAKRDVKNVRREVRKTRERLNGDYSGFRRGWRATDVEGLSGINDFADKMTQLELAKKVREGKPLDKVDEVLLRANELKSTSDMNLATSDTMWEHIGSSTAEQLVTTAEFLAGSYLTGATDISGKVAGRVMSSMGSKAAEEAVVSGARNLLRAGVAEVAGMAAGAAVQTFANPLSYLSMMADYADKRTGTIYYDQNDGQLHYFDNNKSIALSLWQAAAGAYIENFTEFSGEGLDKIGKLGLNKLFSAAPELKSATETIKGLLDKVKFSELSGLNAPAMDDFLRHAGFNGTLGEFGEEVLGNIIRPFAYVETEKGESYGKQLGRGLKNLVDADQNLETFLSCAITSAVLGTVGTVRRTAADMISNRGQKAYDEQMLKDVRDNIAKLDAMMNGVRGLDKEAFKEFIANNNVADISQYIKEQAKANNWTSDELGMVALYVTNVAQQNAMANQNSEAIQQSIDALNEQTKQLVNEWDGEHIYNVTFKDPKTGEELHGAVVNGRMHYTQNDDGTYNFNPYVSSGMLAIRMEDGSVRQVSSRAVTSLDNVTTAAEQNADQGQIVREMMEDQFNKDELMPTVEGAWGFEFEPGVTEIDGLTFVGKDKDGNYQFQVGSNANRVVKMSEERVISWGLRKGIELMQGQAANEQMLNDISSDVQKMSDDADLMDEIDQLKQQNTRGVTAHDLWKQVIDVTSKFVSIDENGLYDEDNTSPNDAAVDLYARAEGNVAAAKENVAKAKAALMSASQQGSLAAVGAFTGSALANQEAQVQSDEATTRAAKQIAFLEQVDKVLDQMGARAQQLAENDAKEEAVKVSSTPVSQMEVGQQFPVEWRGQQAMATVMGKDADGRSVVTVRDMNGEDIEAGIDDMSDADWEAVRVQPQSTTTPEQVAPQVAPQVEPQPQQEVPQPAPQPQPTPTPVQPEPAPIPATSDVQPSIEIPRDKEGNADYDKITDPYVYAAAVTEEFGDEAIDVVNALIESEEAALEGAKKIKDTIKRFREQRESKARLDLFNKVKDIIAPQEQTETPAEETTPVEESPVEQPTAEAPIEETPTEEVPEETPEQPEQPTESVPDWTEDTAKSARERGYRMVDGERVDRQEPIEGVEGNEVEVKFSDTEKPKGKWKVVEAESLQPSHLNKRRNPRFFITEAQPKERKDNASDEASTKIAKDINPEEVMQGVTAYSGSPVINSRGEVIQGNNRTIGLQKMYESYPESQEKYKQALMDKAEQMGLDKEAIGNMQHPVLVRSVDVDDDTAIKLGQKTSQDTESGGKQRMGATQVRNGLGDKYGRLVEMLFADTTDEEGIGEAIARNGVTALKYLWNQKVINNTQYQSALENGDLTAEAKEDFRNIIMESLFEGGPDGLRTAFNMLPAKSQNAILQTIYRDAKSNDESKIKGEVQQAIMAFANLMGFKSFAAAKNQTEVENAVNSWLGQQNMFSDVANTEKYSNFALELAKRFKWQTLAGQRALFNLLYDKLQGVTTEAGGTMSAFDAIEQLGLVEAIKAVYGIDYLKPQQNNGISGSNGVADDNGTRQEGEPGGTTETESGEREESGERPADDRGGDERTGREGQEDKGGEKVEKPKKPSRSADYGSKNTVISNDKYEELKRRMKEKLGGQLNMGFDPEIMSIGAQMAMYHIEAGARKFVDFARNMLEDLGDAIRPHLKAIYNYVRDAEPEEIKEYLDELTPYEEVKNFDLDSLNTEEEQSNTEKDEQDNTDLPERGSGRPESGSTEGGSEELVEGGPRGNGVDTGSSEETGGSTNVPGAVEEVPGGESGMGSGEKAAGRTVRGSGTRSGGRSKSDVGARVGKPNSETGEQGTRQDVGRDPVKEAEQKGYEEEKKLASKESNIDTLKKKRDGFKEKIKTIEDAIKKADLTGRVRALVERIKELLALQPKKETDLSQEKVVYQSVSDPEGTHSIGSVVPSGSAEQMHNALKRIEKEVGMSISEFVRTELGYASEEEMFSDFNEGKTTGLASEQVDSVALAIFKMKKGEGFIVGDMTGVGKGRQAAALIRWGKRQGKKVLFVTDKSDLFSDMYGDLTDIGSDNLTPFVINNDAAANITKDGETLIKKPSDNVKKELFDSGKDELPVNTNKKEKGYGKPYDFVMMTYSQIQGEKIDDEGEGETDTSGALKKTKPLSPKAQWLKNYAKDAIVILDECHKASGDNSNTGRFFRDVVKDSAGVTFLSATYAKRPDNMLLYALKTSIKEANMSEQALIDAISQFGVPMQELMANALFASGEMVRRERDFTDVKTEWLTPKDIYDPEEEKRWVSTYDKTIEIINAIINFQKTFVAPLVKQINDSYADANKAAALTGGPITKAMSTSYASQMSNLMNLMAYSMKAKKAAEMAIEQVKKGEKTVIAVQNTLSSYVDEIDGIIDSDGFSPVWEKGVNFALRYKIVRGKLDKKGHFDKEDGSYQEDVLDIENDLTPDGVMALQSLRQMIDEYNSDKNKEEFCLSPIDYVKRLLAEQGVSCGEITGRSKQLVKDADGKFHVEGLKLNKKETIRRFNGGTKRNPLPESERYDVVILNTAGATGVSMHASKKYGDQKKRNMVILQPAADINVEVQIRGRVDRTGQISRASYFYLASPIPAEYKIIMMMKKKLASLDANAVGTEKVSSNKVDTNDMDNKYGDEVAWAFLNEHREINEMMSHPLPYDVKSHELKHRNGVLYDLLKEIQRFTCEDQRYIINELQERYTEQIDYLNQNGINDLETAVMNLEATTIDKAVFVTGSDNASENEFAHDTNIERVEVNMLKKPLRSSEIRSRMKKMGVIDESGSTYFEWDLDAKEKKTKSFDKYQYKESINDFVDDGVEKLLDELKEKQDKELEELKEQMRVEHPKQEDQSDEEYEKMINTLQEVNDLRYKQSLKYQNMQNEFENNKLMVHNATQGLTPGKICLVPVTDDVTDNSVSMYGRFIGFEKGSGNPRGVKAVFAVKDSRSVVAIPIVAQHKVIEKIISDSNYDEIIRNITGWNDSDEERMKKWDEWWDDRLPKKATNRYIRYMITGNIVQACDKLGKYKGQIVTFTRKDADTGEITTDKGLLLAENFDPENFYIKKEVKKADVWDGYSSIKDDDNKITVGRSGNYLTITFEKRDGESLAKHKALKDEGLKALIDTDYYGEPFYRTKYDIQCVVKEENAEKALEYLKEKYGYSSTELFIMPDSSEKPDAIIYTNEPYQEVIDRLKDKHGGYLYAVENKIKKLLKQYRMDIENETLKKEIREAVQLRQAYYRQQYANAESSDLAWKVIVYDEKINETKDDKERRERYYCIREAIKEELAERGVKGTSMHLENGEWDLKKLRTLFESINTIPERKEMFDRIAKVLDKLGMQIMFSDKKSNDTGGEAAGIYIGYNTKYFNADYITDQMKADTIVHEMIHTMTSYAIRAVDWQMEHLLRNQEIVDTINDLGKLLRIISGSTAVEHKFGQGVYKDYGTTNTHEMLAEVGSNNQFINDLKKIKVFVKQMSGAFTFYDAEKNPSMVGAKQFTAYDLVKERLDLLLDLFNEKAFKEFFRGTQYGAQNYNQEPTEEIERRIENDEQLQKDDDLYRDQEREYEFGETLPIKKDADGRYRVEGLNDSYPNLDRLLDAWRDEHLDYFAEIRNGKLYVEPWNLPEPKTAKEKRYLKKSRERAWRNMHTRADDTIKKLGLQDRVTILDSTDGLEGKKKTAKGWFDPTTGKIVIVMPNHRDPHDVMKTILHEGVAHYGLRQLVGNDNMNEFLDKVFEHASKDVRDRIIDLAMNKYNRNFRKATEEYLAGLAESTNFEDAKDKDWFKKIKAWFMQMLHKVGIDFGNFGEAVDNATFWGDRFTDNELRYLLWKSYRNLVADAESRTELARDVMMQSQLEVGNYAPVSGETMAAEINNGNILPVSEKDSNFAQENVNDEYEERPLRSNAQLEEASRGANGSREADAGAAGELEGNPQSDRRGLRSSRQSKSEQEELIRRKAQRDGKWMTSDDIASITEDELPSGKESKVFMSKDGHHVIKLIDYSVYSKTPSDFQRDRIDLFNALFPETAYELLGYTEDENGNLRFVVKQPYISGSLLENYWLKTKGKVSYSELEPMLEKWMLENYGMRKYGLDAYENDLVRVQDLHLRNVKVDEDGRLYIIDAIPSAKDADSDDILYRDAEPTNHIADEYNRETGANVSGVNAVKRGWEKFARDMFDGLRPLEQMQKLIEKALGRKLRDSEKAYELATQLTSKTGQQIEREQLSHMVPVLQQVTDVIKALKDADGYSRDEAYDKVTNYMLAKHGLERNEWFEKQGKDEGDYAGLRGLAERLGYNPDDYKTAAEVTVKDMEDIMKAAGIDVNEFWKTVNALTNRMLEISYESGMIDKDTFEDFKKRHKYYVPLRGFAEGTAADLFDYVTQSPQFQNIFQKAKGRESMADDPLANLMSMLHSAIVIGNQNQVMQKIYNLAVNSNSDLLRVTKPWYVYNDATKTWEEKYPDIPEGATADEIDAIVKQFNADMAKLKANGKAKRKYNRIDVGKKLLRYQAKEHEMVAYIDGKPVRMYVAGNPLVAQSMNRMNTQHLNKVMQGIQAVTRWYSAINTSWSPAFGPKNAARDIRMMLFGAYTTGGIKKMWQSARDIVKAGWALPRLLITGKMDGGIVKALGKQKAAQLEQWWNEFLDNGGETGFTRTLNAEKAKGEVKDMIRHMLNGSKDGENRVRKYTIGLIEWIGRYSEDISRFAAYCQQRAQGESVLSSIQEAKNVTVNFNVKGGSDLAANMRALYSFFNASMQGINRMRRLATEHPGRFSAGIAAMMLGGAVLPWLNMAMFAMLGGDDDDWRKYEELTEYTANHNMILYVGNHKFISIPWSQELAPFNALGNIWFRQQMGWNKGRSVAEQWGDMFVDLSPISVASGNKPGVGLVKTVMPSFTTPIWESLFNEDFTGSPLYKDNQWNKYDAAWKKAYTGKTSQSVIDASRWLNEKADIDINPAIAEHLFSGVLGGMGRSGDKLLRFFTNGFQLQDAPFIRTMMFDSNPKGYIGAVQREYGRNAYDVLDKVKNDVDDMDAMEFAQFSQTEEFEIANLVSVYKTGKDLAGNKKGIVGIDAVEKEYKKIAGASDGSEEYREQLEEIRSAITERKMEMLDEIQQIKYEHSGDLRKRIIDRVNEVEQESKEKAERKKTNNNQ